MSANSYIPLAPCCAHPPVRCPSGTGHFGRGAPQGRPYGHGKQNRSRAARRLPVKRMDDQSMRFLGAHLGDCRPPATLVLVATSQAPRTLIKARAVGGEAPNPSTLRTKGGNTPLFQCYPFGGVQARPWTPWGVWSVTPRHPRGPGLGPHPQGRSTTPPGGATDYSEVFRVLSTVLISIPPMQAVALCWEVRGTMKVSLRGGL